MQKQKNTSTEKRKSNMHYMNLDSYIKSNHTENDTKLFLNYCELTGPKAVAEEYWSLVSFDAMRHGDSIVIAGNESWSFTIKMDDTFFEIMTYRTSYNLDFNTYLYCITTDNKQEYVNANAEIVNYPNDQMKWCMEKFLIFLDQFIYYKNEKV
jgi:hypothetical protein